MRTADGAEVGGLGDEVGAVQPGAGQRRVDVAGAHRAGVVGDAGDGAVRRRCRARRGAGVGDAQLRGELRQVRAGGPGRAAAARSVDGRRPRLGGWD